MRYILPVKSGHLSPNILTRKAAQVMRRYKESFYQLEQKDERDENATVKTSTQWYSSKTGPAKAHANTSLPSKMNLGIMSPIKRAKPGARTRARARKLRVRGGDSCNEKRAYGWRLREEAVGLHSSAT